MPTSECVWQIVLNFLTKRTTDSTPQRELSIDTRKCRICLKDHHMCKCRICLKGHHTAGADFERSKAYALVPCWTTINLQLALTAKHRLGLRVFDCTAAYLQVELKKPLYARPPKGMMSVFSCKRRSEEDLFRAPAISGGSARPSMAECQKQPGRNTMENSRQAEESVGDRRHMQL